MKTDQRVSKSTQGQNLTDDSAPANVNIALIVLLASPEGKWWMIKLQVGLN